MSFMLNSMINSLPIPDLLRMWNIRGDARCYLWNRSPCTLHPILVNCYPALHGKRYNWRHDSVLSTRHPTLTKQLTSYNSTTTTNLPKHIPIHFITSGNTSTKGIRSQRPSLLTTTNSLYFSLLISFPLTNVPILSYGQSLRNMLYFLNWHVVRKKVYQRQSYVRKSDTKS